MDFYSLSFIFVFLPVSMVIYAAVPGKWRNYMLFAINTAYYLLVGWRTAAITAAAAVIDYGAALFLDYAAGKKRVGTLRLPILFLVSAKNIAGAVLFAVLDEFQTPIAVSGFLVYALTAIGYLIDVFRHETEAERNPVKFLLFSTLFCKMYVGPLVRYGEIKDQLDEKGERCRFSLEKAGEGLVLFLCGAAEKGLLADRIAEFQISLEAVNASAPSVIGSWAAIIIFALRIFFELSGFSDMAKGLGLIFGLYLPENFYYPYQSLSVSDFLYRFNTTATQFFSHYVYDALRPIDASPKRRQIISEILNTLLVCLLFGMWFGVKLCYVIWGIYLALFILLEKHLTGKLLSAMPKLFARICTFVVIMLSFSIFSSSSVYGIAYNLSTLFNFSQDAISGDFIYLVTTNWLLLVLSVLFASSLPALLGRKIKKRAKPAYDIISALFAALLLVIITAFLI